MSKNSSCKCYQNNKTKINLMKRKMGDNMSMDDIKISLKMKNKTGSV